MPHQYGTRNLIELKVGKKHSVQILLHLRPCDVSWFNEAFHEHIYPDLTSLLSKEILPVECREEIQPQVRDDNNGTDSKNTSTSASATGLDGKRKSKPRPASARKNAKQLKPFHKTKTRTKQETLTKEKVNQKKGKESGKNEEEKEKEKEKRPYINSLNSKFLFGDFIQIAYKAKSIRTSHRATLTFATDSNESVTNKSQEGVEDRDNKKGTCASKRQRGNESEKMLDGSEASNIDEYKTLSKFECLKPLSKMIEMWCYPFDGDPKKLTMDVTDGFPRPEFIPISSLFKESL